MKRVSAQAFDNVRVQLESSQVFGTGTVSSLDKFRGNLSSGRYLCVRYHNPKQEQGVSSTLQPAPGSAVAGRELHLIFMNSLIDDDNGRAAHASGVWKPDRWFAQKYIFLATPDMTRMMYPIRLRRSWCPCAPKSMIPFAINFCADLASFLRFVMPQPAHLSKSCQEHVNFHRPRAVPH